MLKTFRRLEWWALSILVSLAIPAVFPGCADDGAAFPGADGGAAGEGGAGGAVADGGTAGGGDGGVAGTGKNGGPGGTGGSGGEGGVGGAGGAEPDWIRDPSIWSEVEFEIPPRNAKVYRGKPGKFEFPKVSWKEDCGKGCSSLRFAFGDVTDEASVETMWTGGGVHLAISHHYTWPNGAVRRAIRRMIRIEDGETVSAVNVLLNSNQEESMIVGIRTEGAGLLVLGRSTAEGLDAIWASFGPETGWDFKGPWRTDTVFGTTGSVRRDRAPLPARG